MKLNKIVNSMISALVLGVSTTAWAHPGHDSTVPSFFDGLVHPFTGLDHMVLLASGGAVLAIVQPKITPSRWWSFGLAGIFAGGCGAMFGNLVIALVGTVLALACLTVVTIRETDRRRTYVALGTTTAISLQAGSHLLAWGDAPPQIDFAIGFGLASLGVFSAAYLLTAVIGSNLVRASRRFG